MHLSNPARADIASRLIDLELELRRLQLWSDEPPAPEALASDQPFAVDCLEFEQWLQFIFLPTLYDLLNRHAPLPSQCGIAPMAEQTFAARAVAADTLIAVLRDLDERITATD